MITSTANPRVKAAAALRRRREREAADRYLVEGPNAVAEALADGDVETVFAVPELAGTFATGPAELVEVSPDVIGRIADSRTPQGVVAVARRRHDPLDAVVGRGFLLVCEAVADPGNLGTIVRTADAAGAAGVVVTAGSVDPWNPKAVRAAAGSLTHLPVVVGVGLDAVARACRAAGQRLVGLDAHGTTTVDEPAVFAPPVALVAGNEAHGLSRSAHGVVDQLVAVPRYGRAESLNLSAAIAVAAYAAARRVHPGRDGDAAPPAAAPTPWEDA